LDESVGDGWRAQSPGIGAKVLIGDFCKFNLCEFQCQQKKEGMGRGPKKLKIRPKKNQVFSLKFNELILHISTFYRQHFTIGAPRWSPDSKKGGIIQI
jgi:hypothetical protein